MTGSRLWQRRREEPRTLDALLGDPDTVDAAECAFAAAGQDDAPWWPCAALVGLETVTVRLAGLKVPEPAAPWRAEHEPHVWTADRSELAEVEPGETGRRLGPGRLLVIGRYQDSVVFIDTTRAAGPLEVAGEPEQAERVRELIAGQLRGHPTDARAPGGAHWPVEVRDDIIVLIGLAVASVLSEEDSRLACDLMLRAANRTPSSRLGRPESSASAPPDGEPGQQEAMDAWLRQVKEAAARAAAPHGFQHRAEPQPTPPSQAQPKPFDGPPPADDDAYASSSAPQGAEPPAPLRPEPTPPPPLRPTGAPAQDPDTEDWAAGFAVSSAEEQPHR